MKRQDISRYTKQILVGCLCVFFFRNAEAVMNSELKNDRYIVRLETQTSDRLTVMVEKSETQSRQEIVIGGKAFDTQYGSSIVNLIEMKLFEQWLIVYGEMWNNGDLVHIFDVETGLPQKIAGQLHDIAIWCYKPVLISPSGRYVAFVNGYPRNANVNHVVSIFDIKHLSSPPTPIYPKENAMRRNIWFLEDEHITSGPQGTMVWTPDETGLIFLAKTVSNGMQPNEKLERLELVHIDLHNGVEQSKILVQLIDVTQYLTEEFLQQGKIPYLFPVIRLTKDEQVEIQFESSSTNKTSTSDQQPHSIWNTPSIILPIPHQ